MGVTPLLAFRVHSPLPLLIKVLGHFFLSSMYPDFYLHISNFSISLIIGLLGSFWLLVGAPFKAVTLLTLLLLIANLLSETVFGFMNTPDRIDFFLVLQERSSHILLWQ